MTLEQIINSAKTGTDPDGNPVVQIDLPAWKELMALLEDLDDSRELTRLREAVESGREEVVNWVSAGKMTLEIETDENGDIIIWEPTLNVYGVGHTIEAAIAEFSSMMMDLHEELDASEDTLSQPLRLQLGRLRTILAPGYEQEKTP
ncbi:MAG TPA: hypothetical protein VGD99_20210 [Anaerolineae bacterium]|jgi:hypothetical protein